MTIVHHCGQGRYPPQDGRPGRLHAPPVRRQALQRAAASRLPGRSRPSTCCGRPSRPRAAPGSRSASRLALRTLIGRGAALLAPPPPTSLSDARSRIAMTTRPPSRAHRERNSPSPASGPQPRGSRRGEDRVWLSSARFASILDAVAPARRRGDQLRRRQRLRRPRRAARVARRGLHATFFVVAGRLGAPGFLGEDDVRAPADRRHDDRLPRDASPRWRNLDDRELDEELREARTPARRTSSAARSPTLHARSAPMTGGCSARCAAMAMSRVFTSDGGPAGAGSMAAGAQQRSSRGPTRRRRATMLSAPPLAALRAQAKLAVKRWR